MSEDPIVAEVRTIRRELQEEAGDLKTFFERLRKAGGKYANKVVDSVPGPAELSAQPLRAASG